MKRRWLLVPIAIPAAMAIWSGWVGLGGMCGFGVVNLLPGIGGGFTINTAITLPIGVESYGAYALGVWVGTSGSDRARTFAGWSAIGALAYGMLGQVVYHLLAAAHVTAAPWPIVVLVSCMPVVVLGFAAALTHLLGEDEDAAGEQSSTGGVSDSPAALPAFVAASLPKLREIQRRQQCGIPTSRKARAEVERYARTVAALNSSPAGDTGPRPPAGVNGHKVAADA